MASKINTIYSVPYEGYSPTSNGEFKGNHVIPVSSSLSGSKSGSEAERVLDYGINIFEYTESGSDYCVLPSNKVGNSIYVINRGVNPLIVSPPYTNEIQGTISGLDQGEAAMIPQDEDLYQFVDLGNNRYSTINLLRNKFIQTYYITVNHVSESMSTVYWCRDNNTNMIISGSPPPYFGSSFTWTNGVPTYMENWWGTFNTAGVFGTTKSFWVLRVRIDSNVLKTDMPVVGSPTGNAGAIVYNLYRQGPNPANTSYGLSTSVSKYIPNASSNHNSFWSNPANGSSPYYARECPTTAPPYNGNIGDAGTIYMVGESTYRNSSLYGLGWEVSYPPFRSYYTNEIGIYPSSLTKTYKFKVTLLGFVI